MRKNIWLFFCSWIFFNFFAQAGPESCRLHFQNNALTISAEIKNKLAVTRANFLNLRKTNYDEKTVKFRAGDKFNLKDTEYSVIELLGWGGEGAIYKVKNSANEIFVIKHFTQQKAYLENIRGFALLEKLGIFHNKPLATDENNLLILSKLIEGIDLYHATRTDGPENILTTAEKNEITEKLKIILKDNELFFNLRVFELTGQKLTVPFANIMYDFSTGLIILIDPF